MPVGSWLRYLPPGSLLEGRPARDAITGSVINAGSVSPIFSNNADAIPSASYGLSLITGEPGYRYSGRVITDQLPGASVLLPNNEVNMGKGNGLSWQ
jgi:hypothetical protein